MSHRTDLAQPLSGYTCCTSSFACATAPTAFIDKHPMVQIRWRSSDLSRLATHPLSTNLRSDPTATQPLPTSFRSDPTAEAGTSGPGLGPGPIAGIVVGAIALVVILGVLIFFILRHRSQRLSQPQPPDQEIAFHESAEVTGDHIKPEKRALDPTFSITNAVERNTLQNALSPVELSPEVIATEINSSPLRFANLPADYQHERNADRTASKQTLAGKLPNRRFCRKCPTPLKVLLVGRMR